MRKREHTRHASHGTVEFSRSDWSARWNMFHQQKEGDKKKREKEKEQEVLPIHGKCISNAGLMRADPREGV